MDLGQITLPPNNAKTTRFFKGDGVLWFIETSWHYIAPRDPWEVIKFLVQLSGATWRYKRLMRADRRKT